MRWVKTLVRSKTLREKYILIFISCHYTLILQIVLFLVRLKMSLILVPTNLKLWNFLTTVSDFKQILSLLINIYELKTTEIFTKVTFIYTLFTDYATSIKLAIFFRFYFVGVIYLCVSFFFLLVYVHVCLKWEKGRT